MDRCYGGKNGWQICTACDGRIHRVECTSTVNPAKDCCPARHTKLGLPRESAQIRLAASAKRLEWSKRA